MRAALVSILVVIIVAAIVATQHRAIRDWLEPDRTAPSATVPVAPPDASQQASPPPTGTAESGTAEPAPKPETASTGTAPIATEAPPAPATSAETRAAARAPAAERKTAGADATPTEPEKTPAAAPAPAAERKMAGADATPTEPAKTPATAPAPVREAASTDAAPAESAETRVPSATAPETRSSTPSVETVTTAPAPAPAPETAGTEVSAAATEAPAARAVEERPAATAPASDATAPAVVRAMPPKPAEAGAPPPSSVARALPGDAEEAPSEAATPAAKTPSFDVVRVSPEGDAVIAGRAEPGAGVTVKDGDAVLGEATADRRGEWVVVPEKRVPSGAHELRIEEETVSGGRRSSEEVVVVLVPERAPEDAGRPGEAVVVATPRAGGASRILQAPAGSPDPAAAPADTQAAARDTAPQPPAPRTDKDLSLEIIDYDEEGRVVLSGKAPPGSEVRAKVDEDTVGTVRADEAGTWRITPVDPVVSDRHAIRIEQVGEGGVVLAKLSVPFSRAAVRPGELAPGTVVIKPGHNLWRIARATYGAGIKYTLIFAANADQIDDPHLIYPDQIFVVPPEALPDRFRRSAP